ncbi:MAG TPA: hypothetical protein VGB18_07930, partial [Candidatus Thermoplasmatota archaeon]
MRIAHPVVALILLAGLAGCADNPTATSIDARRVGNVATSPELDAFERRIGHELTNPPEFSPHSWNVLPVEAIPG